MMNFLSEILPYCILAKWQGPMATLGKLISDIHQMAVNRLDYPPNRMSSTSIYGLVQTPNSCYLN